MISNQSSRVCVLLVRISTFSRLQRVAYRHKFAMNLGPNAGVPDIGVHRVRKAERRRPREALHITGGGKDKHLVGVNSNFSFHKVLCILCLTRRLEDLTDSPDLGDIRR